MSVLQKTMKICHEFDSLLLRKACINNILLSASVRLYLNEMRVANAKFGPSKVRPYSQRGIVQWIKHLPVAQGVGFKPGHEQRFFFSILKKIFSGPILLGTPAA